MNHSMRSMNSFWYWTSTINLKKNLACCHHLKKKRKNRQILVRICKGSETHFCNSRKYIRLKCIVGKCHVKELIICCFTENRKIIETNSSYLKKVNMKKDWRLSSPSHLQSFWDVNDALWCTYWWRWWWRRRRQE